MKKRGKVTRAGAMRHNEGIESAAKLVAEFAEHYPTDIFPEDGQSIECKSAKFARHLCNILSQQIRDLKIKREV